jgi:exosortase
MTAAASLPVVVPCTPAAERPAPAWLLVVAGLLLLYFPTYRDIAATYWDTEQGAHGLVVLGMWFWLLWRERAALASATPTPAGSAVGWVAIVIGATCYALGRSQQMFQLEAGSQLLLLPGISLLLLGPSSTRRLWFVWLFLAFTVPLPGSLVDSLLVAMKELIAAAVTQSLYTLGLPIGRDGVVIYIGPYQLFIADACSGLNQLVALAAIGLLYVRVAGRRSVALTAVLLAAIAPIAVFANLLRVLSLVLATYFGGDLLGRQLHDVVSFAEIVLAFGAFFALDRVARFCFGLGERVE